VVSIIMLLTTGLLLPSTHVSLLQLLTIHHGAASHSAMGDRLKPVLQSPGSILNGLKLDILNASL
jgi:hypothetical protein